MCFYEHKCIHIPWEVIFTAPNKVVTMATMFPISLWITFYGQRLLRWILDFMNSAPGQTQATL